MHLIAKLIRIADAKFHSSRLTTVQDIQDYACIIFWHTLYKDSARTLIYRLVFESCKHE